MGQGKNISGKRGSEAAGIWAPGLKRRPLVLIEDDAPDISPGDVWQIFMV